MNHGGRVGLGVVAGGNSHGWICMLVKHNIQNRTVTLPPSVTLAHYYASLCKFPPHMLLIMQFLFHRTVFLLCTWYWGGHKEVRFTVVSLLLPTVQLSCYI